MENDSKHSTASDRSKAFQEDNVAFHKAFKALTATLPDGLLLDLQRLQLGNWEIVRASPALLFTAKFAALECALFRVNTCQGIQLPTKKFYSPTTMN